MIKNLLKFSALRQPVTSAATNPADKNIHQLTYFKDNRCRLLIKINHHAQSYQSIILSIDALNKTLLIDDLFPAPEIKPHTGEELLIEYHEQGKTSSFTCNFITSTRLNGFPALLISMPENMTSDQRRNSYRLQLQKNQILGATLYANRYESLSGIIKNISSQGIRINIHGNKSDELKQGDIINNCLISLDETNQIECQLTIRNKYYFHLPYRHTQVGAEITNIQLNQKNSLIHYVTQQQRLQCREKANNEF